MQRIPGITSLTDNSLMAVLFAGGILGIAAGLVFRVGASTGGTDVVNLVLHKWFHLPVSVFVYIVDFIILGAQAVRKSYPTFFEDFTALGGIVHVESDR